MSIDIWTDSMQHAELFGTPVLFTNWLVQRDTIPQGWHCYDLRGTRKAPNARITLVDQEVGYHAGTVLSPTPLKREGVTSRRVNGTFYLLGEELTLEQFCEEHDLPCPQDIREFVLRPASPNEAGLFFPNWNLRKMRPWARLAMCEWTSATEEGSSGIAGGLITGTGSISRSLKRCYSDW